MASTILEQTRAKHEEVERLERLIVKDLLGSDKKQQTHKDRLLQSHRVKDMIERMVTASKQLVEVYEDKDGARKEEIATLGGQQAEGENVFSIFYDRMKEIDFYHRKHPSARTLQQEDLEEEMKAEPTVDFTGEEAFGKYLDLHELYNVFINAKFGKQMEYMQYLEDFPETQHISRHHKFTKQYKEYISNLVAYLQSFYERTQPLQDLAKLLTKVEEAFAEHWEQGRVPGWEDRGQGFGAENGSDREVKIDVDDYDSVEELLELGPERIKEALVALGLKSGGTLRERAERLLLTKGVALEAVDPKHFAKGRAPRQKSVSAEELQKRELVARELALLEAKVHRFCALLQEVIQDTKGNQEKKQSRTVEEMEAEREEEEAPLEEEESDEEGQIYNPLKLPLGPDGKPIPYWLYKLHGLNQEFKCEICGDQSYWGRRAFERHFREWRHQHGMKAIGVPNTKQFNEITQIKDALELWKSIQEKSGSTKFRPEQEEEYEDNEGNVFNKRAYIDLQRQGLI